MYDFMDNFTGDSPQTVDLFHQLNKDRNLSCILCFYEKRGQLEFYCFYIWLLKWHTGMYASVFFFDFICFIIITDNKIITGGKS